MFRPIFRGELLVSRKLRFFNFWLPFYSNPKASYTRPLLGENLRQAYLRRWTHLGLHAVTFDELCQDRPQTFTGNRSQKATGSAWLGPLVGGGLFSPKQMRKKRQAPSKNLSGDGDDDDDDDDGYDFDFSFQWN